MQETRKTYRAQGSRKLTQQNMKNQIQLITYVDRLGQGTLRDLKSIIDQEFEGLFGGVHLLPFFTPIDGADAGFDPVDHTEVDSRLGGWDDVKALGQSVELMADVIVNHMSVDSPQFRDYSAKGSASKYAGMFLTLSSVYPNGATEQDWLALYRPRPGLPLTVVTLKTGERKILWTTFTSKQVDIDVKHSQGHAYLQSILHTLAHNGIKQIRLDAVGYAIKKAGASSFMMPETMAFIDEFTRDARALGLEVLVEIHSYYRTQIEIAKQVDWVYDFALPPLVLHAICYKTSRYLKKWIDIRPTNALTVLDTHDGIGVIDVGADSQHRDTRPGLVPPSEIDHLVEWIHENSRGESRAATGAAASNLDLYQVNCTYYDALGRDNRAYLLARAIQFFVPGVPQVYYVGLLVGENDMDLLAKTGVGRDINRHYYSRDEIHDALDKPAVQDLASLMRLRNTHRAFGGEFSCTTTGEQKMVLAWHAGEAASAELSIDFATLTFTVHHADHDVSRRKVLFKSF
jgi:sucrose phosphorylase